MKKNYENCYSIIKTYLCPFWPKLNSCKEKVSWGVPTPTYKIFKVLSSRNGVKVKVKVCKITRMMIIMFIFIKLIIIIGYPVCSE